MSNHDAKATAAWLYAGLVWIYDVVVALAAHFVGEAVAQSWVDNSILVVFGIMTTLMIFYVLREVSDIGYRMLRVVLATGAAAVMMYLLANLFYRMHPTQASQKAVEETVRRTATAAANQTTSWLFARLAPDAAKWWW